MEIQPVSSVVPSTPQGHLAPAESQSGDGGFRDVLMNVVQQANTNLQAADQALVDFSSGKTDDIQSVVMSTVKADLSFRFFLEMRNKLTESYQELSRMQF